jgi:hypothetical protein
MLGACPQFSCKRCFKRGEECVRASGRYKKIYSSLFLDLNKREPPRFRASRRARLSTDNTATATTPSCVIQPADSTPPPSRDSSVRSATYAAPCDSSSALMFWRNEFVRAKSAMDAASNNYEFTKTMLFDTIEHRIAPLPSGGERSRRVRLLKAPTVNRVGDKGKDRA